MDTSFEAVQEAIRKAGQELGRAPSRAELKRLTGVSHFVVLKHFPTLRDAVEAAGFTPHIKGRRASTAELLEDYGRVARLLGRRPSRAEYARAGRYSAGTFTQRFGGWVEAGEEWERSKELPKSPEISPQINTDDTDQRHEKINSDQCDQCSSVVKDGSPAFILRPGQPAEIPGMRCITEEVAAMIVGGLLGPRKWRLQIGEVEFTRVDHHAIGSSGHREIGSSEERIESKDGTQHSAVGAQEESRESPESEFSRERARTLRTEEDRIRSESPGAQDFQSANPLVIPPLIHGQPGQVCAEERRSEGLPKPQRIPPLIHTDDTDQRPLDLRLPNPLVLPKSPESPELPKLKNGEAAAPQLPNRLVLPKSPGLPRLPEFETTGARDLELPNWQLPQSRNGLSNEIVIRRRAVARAGGGWPDDPITPSAGVPGSALRGLGLSADLLRRLNVDVISGRLRRDRPVMGPPLHPFAMTNAPSNEGGWRRCSA